MLVHCFMVAVIFVVTSDITHALNIKAVLTATRSIACPSLLCGYSFHNVLILVNLCT